MTERGILIVVILVIVIILPLVRRIFTGSTSAKLRSLKSKPTSKRVLFIFGGMMAPRAEKFQYLADDYDGDVIYVEYAHDGCGMDKYCLQIRQLVAMMGYRRVDVLGISIGAAMFPTLVELLGRSVDLRLYGICPIGVGFLHLKVYWKAQIAMVFLAFMKITLGLIGEIPMFYWNGSRRSLSEFAEQYAIVAWGNLFWHECYLVDGYPVWIQPDRYHSQGYFARVLKGLVLAEGDELIDNERVEHIYRAAPIKYVPGKRACLDSSYVEALRELGLYDCE